jgi:hypothetical protein
MTLALSREEALSLGCALTSLVAGETLARDCARWQAGRAEDPRFREFFRSQARQEDRHRLVFATVSRRLAPAARPAPGLAPYRALLESAMAAGRDLEVLVGQQVVLEAFGEVVLLRLDRGMARRGAGFAGLRRTILGQEHAHQAFGRRRVHGAIAAGHTELAELGRTAAPYLESAQAVLDDVAQHLQRLGEDPLEYRRDLLARLPRWAAPGGGP